MNRRASRVLLVDDAERILLLCARGDDGSRYWFTVGGGLLDGESWEEAARRELREETGVAASHLGPVVWRREHVFTWLGTTYLQRERFFLLRVGATTIDTRGWLRHERDALVGHRWWNLGTLARSGVNVSPRRLVVHLAPLLHGIFPVRPIDVGE